VPLLSTPDGRLEYLVSGAGDPVTVFAHGLAGSIPDTRPLGSGVAGTRVFFHFGGHGRSTGTGWSYDALAADLRYVADAVGARRALGVSMGAGALAALLAESPDRFERAVFFLPGVLDRARSGPALRHFSALADAAEAGDRGRLAALLGAELPAAVRERPAARDFVDGRAGMLLRSALGPALRSLPTQLPVPDRALLAAVGVPVLVVAQAADDLHPVEVARELAGALPDATLKIFSSGAALWLARRELREVLAGFLNG